MVMDAALKGMNDKQSEAVLATEGPVLIMAGAGSGKTRVLTHRIAYLVEEKHVNPWNILAITFTNKAAREMRERVGKLVDAEIARDIWGSTFHALCVRILRRDIDKLGYNRAFTIADPAEQLTLVKHILADFNLDPKRYDPKSILGAISSAKNELVDPQTYANEQANSPFTKVVAQVYAEYQKRLRSDQALDFDDLIMQTIVLFEKTKKHWHSTSVSSATFMLTNIRTLTKHNTSSCICWQKATIIYVWLVMPTRAFMAGVVPICRIFWISKRLSKGASHFA